MIIILILIGLAFGMCYWQTRVFGIFEPVKNYEDNEDSLFHHIRWLKEALNSHTEAMKEIQKREDPEPEGPKTEFDRIMALRWPEPEVLYASESERAAILIIETDIEYHKEQILEIKSGLRAYNRRSRKPVASLYDADPKYDFMQLTQEDHRRKQPGYWKERNWRDFCRRFYGIH